MAEKTTKTTNQTMELETSRVEELLEALREEARNQNVDPRKIAEIYNESIAFKNEMVRDYGLGDRLFKSVREGLNDLGDFYENTKDHIENTMHKYGDMIKDSIEDLKLRGEVALTTFMEKMRGFKEQYHDYITNRNRASIEKMDKKIDDIQSKAKYRTNIQETLKNVRLAIQGKNPEPISSEIQFKPAEERRIEKLTGHINDMLEAIANRQASDIEEKLKNVGSLEQRDTLFTYQLTEIAKAAGKELVIGYVDGDTILSLDEAPEELKANQKPVVVSMETADNQKLHELMNSDLLFKTLVQYEITAEEQYREERNKEIAGNIEKYLEEIPVNEMETLEKQIETEELLYETSEVDGMIKKFYEEHPELEEAGLDIHKLQLSENSICMSVEYTDGRDEQYLQPIAYINSDGSITTDTEWMNLFTHQEQSNEDADLSEPDEFDVTENW